MIKIIAGQVASGVVGSVLAAVFIGAAPRDRARPVREPVGPVAGSAVADIVAARKFVLEDDPGRTRAALGVVDGKVCLTLCDTRGRPRLSLLVDPSGAAGLNVGPTEGASVLLGSVEDKAVIRIDGADGNPVFKVPGG